MAAARACGRDGAHRRDTPGDPVTRRLLRPLRRAAARLRGRGAELGMTTAEYAIGTLVPCFQRTRGSALPGLAG